MARWLVVAVVGVGGVLLSRSLLEEPITGVTNADEATTGIMALTILRGNVPLMLPGQAYSGTLEAYALAPFYALFGTSNLALKLVNVFLWGVAAVVCYFLARLVLTRLGATAAALLVWVPGLALILLSTRAYPGYATGLLAYLAALYCLGRVAEADQPTVLGSLIAGFLSGLAIWLHPMFACLVAPAIVVVTWRHRHALLRWLGPALVGVVVGMAPFLGYNLTNGWASLHQPPSAVGDVSYVDRLQAFVMQLWPRALGLRGISAVGPWSFTGREVRVHHRHRGGVCRARAALAARLGGQDAGRLGPGVALPARPAGRPHVLRGRQVWHQLHRVLRHRDVCPGGGPGAAGAERAPCRAARAPAGLAAARGPAEHLQRCPALARQP